MKLKTILTVVQLVLGQNLTTINGTAHYNEIMKLLYANCTNPTGPEVRCDLVPDVYQSCQAPLFVSAYSSVPVSNETIELRPYHECVLEELGGQWYHETKSVYVNCTVLTGIDCCGARRFPRLVPCIRYKLDETGACSYSYPTSVILSVFVGILGGDRFYLGHTASAIGKLFTLGGLGVWWIVDIILLLTGQLMPAGGYSWCNNY